MTSQYSFEFLHSGTRHDFAWLVCKGMDDDPMDLYKRLPSIQSASKKRLLTKILKKADGMTLQGDHAKPLDYKGTRFLELKDNSSKTRFLAVNTTYTNSKGEAKALYLIVSGIEGKKEDQIPEGHLIRAKARWEEVERQVLKGEFKLWGIV